MGSAQFCTSLRGPFGPLFHFLCSCVMQPLGTLGRGHSFRHDLLNPKFRVCPKYLCGQQRLCLTNPETHLSHLSKHDLSASLYP